MWPLERANEAVEKFRGLAAYSGGSEGIGIARYKRVDMSPRLLPVYLEAQLVPGTLAHGPHQLIDELDLLAFDALSQR